MKLIEMKCPSCGAALQVEEGRQFTFCQYCGTKIMISDEEKVTIRYIDDAGLTRAQTEQMVQMKEIELQEKRQKNQRAWWIVGAVVCGLMLVAGAVLMATKSYSAGYTLMSMAVFLGLFGGMTLLAIQRKDKRTSLTQSGIRISSALANYRGQRVQTIAQLLKDAGFTNVTLVPVRDLGLLSGWRNGMVDKLIIAGDDSICEGDIFSADAAVTLSYHTFMW